jgi:hypothetical protein
MQVKSARFALVFLVCVLAFSFSALAQQTRTSSQTQSTAQQRVIPSPDALHQGEESRSALVSQSFLSCCRSREGGNPQRELQREYLAQLVDPRLRGDDHAVRQAVGDDKPARPTSAVIPIRQQTERNPALPQSPPPQGTAAMPTAPSGQAVESRTRVIVPHLIKFGGVLTDLAGKPMTGPMDVTFSLYKDQAGGEPLWFETQRVELDAAGHYTVLLGAMHEGGVPVDLFMSGQAQWLGVAAGNGPEQPRVLMVSVPYALEAANAETLGGKPPSEFMLAKPGSKTAQALTTNATGSTPVTTAGGTIGYLPMWDSSSDITNANIFQNGSGQVSIGTTLPGDPTTLLHIYGDVQATHWPSVSFKAQGQGEAALFGVDPTGTEIASIGAGKSMRFLTTTSGGTLTKQMQINTDGSVSLVGDLNLPLTTSASVGVINLGGVPFIHACCSTPTYNVFMGTDAGNFATSGVENTGVGQNALLRDSTGSYNDAFGAGALGNNTSGKFNTASGQVAAGSVTTGSYNTSSGYASLFSDDTNSQNTAFGACALFRTYGTFPPSISCALPAVTTGSGDTAVGTLAGETNTAGELNTFVGYQADTNASGTALSGLTNATAIGANAVVGESNAIVLGSINGQNGATSDVNVGIGTSTPTEPLHVATGDVYASQAGSGVIVKSPDGSKCARIGIDNTGAIAVTSLTCP